MDLESLKYKEPFFLEVARKKVGGRRTWVCPNCGNGKGRDGDGISLDPNSKNSPHYKCFKCGLYGDIIDLYRYQKGLSSNSEAFKEFCELEVRHDYSAPLGYSRTSNNSIALANKNQQAQRNNSVEPQVRNFSSFLEEASEHITETDYHRGISLKTLKRFKVGFIPNWRHPKVPNSVPTPRLIIPTSDSSYLARSTVDDSKIKVGNVRIFNADSICRQDSAALASNDFQAEQNTASNLRFVFITEGEIDALSIIDVGGEAVALGGVANISLLVQQIEAASSCTQKSTQLGNSLEGEVKNQLAQRNSAGTAVPERNNASNLRFVLVLDNDRAGEAAADKLEEEFRHRNIPFYRPKGFYGEFKDANEVLTHSRELLRKKVEEATQETMSFFEQQENAERESYLKNSVENYIDNFINGVHDLANTRCIPTGFQHLDAVLDGGLFEGLYIFGAISSLGKTTFVLQIADQIAKQGQDVLIFSLEMARTELMAKSISRLTLLSGNHRNAKTTRGITMGSRYADYSAEEIETINRAVERYRSYARNIFIHEGVGDIGTDQIRAEIEKHIRTMGTKPVVVIDYVQILAPADVRATDKQNTDKAVLELKRISRDFKIPVLGISSFNRTSYKDAVNMGAFKESGSLEYGSDVLIGLQLRGAGKENFDVDAAKQADPRKVEVVILKNRNGATGKHLMFDYYAKFNCFDEER